jgi:hypothetical protein
MATDSVSAAAVSAAAVSKVAAGISVGQTNVFTYHYRVQQHDPTAWRRTIPFFATGTLPGKGSMSANGGAFADTTNAPTTVSGNWRKLVLDPAEIKVRGTYIINITTTVTPSTTIIILDVIAGDPFVQPGQ